MSRYRLCFLLMASSAMGAGCVTPSIPIPPPEPEKMVFEQDAEAGTASFAFEPNSAYPSAIVYVFNRSEGVGIIETARMDGSVGPTRPFAAQEGNQIVISFELETQIASTCVEFRDGRSSSALECNL